MRVLIDADGCPVVDEAVSLCRKHGVPCLILCDNAHRFDKPGAETLVFDRGADSVDLALFNRLKKDDIAVTQDYGLAALCLTRGARVLDQNGSEYTDASIGALLAEREAAGRIRRAGGRLKGPRRRTAAQDLAFENELSRMLTEAERGAGRAQAESSSSAGPDRPALRSVRRGWVPADRREFGAEALPKLAAAAGDLRCLLDRGYDVARAGTFVGDHYQLTARQRTALARGLAPAAACAARRRRRIAEPAGTVWIDGLNAVITLEVALGGGLLLRGDDGAIRDLAGLHGSWRMTAATPQAVTMILDELERHPGVSGAEVLLDEPVSNSGRLKALFEASAGDRKLPVKVRLVPDPDAELAGKAELVSGDAVLLDRCESWYNLTGEIISERIPGAWIFDVAALQGPEPERPEQSACRPEKEP